MSASVLDASAMVDILTGQRAAAHIRERLESVTVHVPAHFDAEVISALGKLCRAGHLAVDEAGALVASLARAPFVRHVLDDLVEGAWRRRDNLRLVDALYVELAERLQVPLLTTNGQLAAAYPAAHLPDR